MTALAQWLERDRLAGPVRIRQAVILAVAVGYLLFTDVIARGSLYGQSLVLTAACFAILAVSLDLVAGMTGLYSLGHAGLFACGAYATTLLNSHEGVGVFPALPLVVAGTGVVGLLLGSLSLRVSGLYFAITTFIFTLVVGVLASDLPITGGLQGLWGPLFPNFPASLAGLGSSVAWCVMLALLLTIFLAWSIRRSALYPVLLAIRDAEPFAAAAGVRTATLKIGLFGISAALAGLAGWCFSFLGILSPGPFSWNVSVSILVMVVLRGLNTPSWPITGAASTSAPRSRWQTRPAHLAELERVGRPPASMPLGAAARPKLNMANSYGRHDRQNREPRDRVEPSISGGFIAFWRERMVFENGRAKKFETEDDAWEFLARCDAAGKIIH